MLLDPTTPAGQAFIADWLGEDASDPEQVECFIHDNTTACLICAELFTSDDDDFEPDALEQHGERICHACSAQGDRDPVDAHREWGTW